MDYANNLIPSYNPTNVPETMQNPPLQPTPSFGITNQIPMGGMSTAHGCQSTMMHYSQQQPYQENLGMSNGLQDSRYIQGFNNGHEHQQYVGVIATPCQYCPQPGMLHWPTYQQQQQLVQAQVQEHQWQLAQAQAQQQQLAQAQAQQRQQQLAQAQAQQRQQQLAQAQAQQRQQQLAQAQAQEQQQAQSHPRQLVHSADPSPACTRDSSESSITSTTGASPEYKNDLADVQPTTYPTEKEAVPFEWMKKKKHKPNPGKTRTEEIYRTVYTKDQRIELEKEFCTDMFISIERRAELSITSGLSERQIKIWFQNRRVKDRKEQKKRIEMEKQALVAYLEQQEQQQHQHQPQQQQRPQLHDQLTQLQLQPRQQQLQQPQVNDQLEQLQLQPRQQQLQQPQLHDQPEQLHLQEWQQQLHQPQQQQYHHSIRFIIGNTAAATSFDMYAAPINKMSGMLGDIMSNTPIIRCQPT